MRLPLIMTLLSTSALQGAASAKERQLDRSKEFAYTLPDGWKIVPGSVWAHDVLVLPAEDGKNRNINIVHQPGTSSFAELKRLYERDLPRGLKEFQLISCELVELKGNEAGRIIHLNTTPGIPVRQVNYILEVRGKRYFVTCTVLEEDGDKYDKVFEVFANSISEPDK